MPAAVLATVLALGGCAQTAQLGSDQLEDLGRYLDQNHDRRYEVRRQAHQAVDYAVNVCLYQSDRPGACDAAIARANKVVDFLEENYPELVTVQAAKDTVAAVDRLRRKRLAVPEPGAAAPQ